MTSMGATVSTGGGNEAIDMCMDMADAVAGSSCCCEKSGGGIETCI